MGKDFINGKMIVFILEIMLMEINMDKDCILGQMEKNYSVIGLIMNLMVMGILLLMEKNMILSLDLEKLSPVELIWIMLIEFNKFKTFLLFFHYY